MEKKHNILIIKHSSLGDWIKATGFFYLIHKKFAGANIILITSNTYAQLAYSSGYFNEVWFDIRDPLGNWSIFKKILSFEYTHVFDLQSSIRTKLYRPFIKSRSIIHYLKRRKAMHDVEQMLSITKEIGLNDFPTPNIEWLSTSVNHLNIPKKFCLFIPGCSYKHPEKRWSPEEYAKTIDWLAKSKIGSVIIGNEEDKNIVNAIMSLTKSQPINLINKVGFHGIAALARKAICTIGSDTGPLHIAAATNANVIVIFPYRRKLAPEHSKPWGKNVQVVVGDYSNHLRSNHVIEMLREL